LGKERKEEQESMRFLVTIDATDVGVETPPERLAQVLDQMIVPSIEKLAQWEQEGRIHGGGFTGARGNTFIVDAESSEEMDQLVTSLPHWSLVKVDVKPLIPHSALLERVRALRQMAQERVR
jgi:muconolactone delta-isomerase